MEIAFTGWSVPLIIAVYSLWALAWVIRQSISMFKK